MQAHRRGTSWGNDVPLRATVTAQHERSASDRRSPGPRHPPLHGLDEIRLERRIDLADPIWRSAPFVDHPGAPQSWHA